MSPPAPQVGVPLPARWSGEGRSSWHEAHREARAEVEHLEARLRALRDLLRERSGDWHATESSAGVPPDPELVRLRAEFKRDRQSLELAHRRLAELECDALIAGVSLEALE